MIAVLYQKHIYLRVAIGMFMVLLIAVKAAAPAFVSFKAADKEASSLTENDSDAEKKAENSASGEKEKEFTGAGHEDAAHILWHTYVIHLTGYQNNYQTTHFLKVTSPPPDIYLHPTC